METRTVFCPHCQSSLDTPVSLEGKEVQCPICKKNFTVIFQEESVEENPPMDSPQEKDQAQFFFRHSEQSDYSPQKQNPLKIVEKKKTNHPFAKRILLLWITGGCACLLIIMNILMGFSLFVQQENVNKLEKRLQGLAKDINELASNTSYKPVTEYKIINYTWEYSALMESEFKNALAAGFEPAGYLCQNSIKGGMFLFVKRGK